MKAFIYTGGKINKSGITEHPRSGDLRIAADAGYKNALELGEGVDLLLGDFDSYTGALPEDVETLRVPAEKDFTDTQMAVREALARGAEELVIIGGLSGRLDHTLSNIYLLESLTNSGIYACICDGKNRVRYLKERSSLLIQKSEYKYFGLLPADREIKGVSIDGAKYPLKNAKLTRNDPSFAISNEVTENFAMVSTKKGGLFVIESKE